MLTVPFYDGEVRQDEWRLQYDGVRTYVVEYHKVTHRQRSVVVTIQVVALDTGVTAKVQMPVFLLLLGLVVVDRDGRVLPIQCGVDIIDTSQKCGDGLSPDVLDAHDRGNELHHVTHQGTARLNEQSRSLLIVVEMTGNEGGSLTGIILVSGDGRAELCLQLVLHLPEQSAS